LGLTSPEGKRRFWSFCGARRFFLKFFCGLPPRIQLPFLRGSFFFFFVQGGSWGCCLSCPQSAPRRPRSSSFCWTFLPGLRAFFDRGRCRPGRAFFWCVLRGDKSGATVLSASGIWRELRGRISPGKDFGGWTAWMIFPPPPGRVF